MKYEKRSNRDGSSYFSFVHYDVATKKTLRLTRQEIRDRFGHDIVTEAEAKECVQLLEAQYESEKIRIKRRLEWEKQYYNFVGLVEKYTSWQKKNAPESWINNVFYLKHYVLPFFLGQKKLNNAELWPDFFDEYKEWLVSGAMLLRTPTKTISYSSKNHAIKALNTFLTLMYRQKLVSVEATCTTFPDHLVGHHDLDDVIMPDEADKVQFKLREMGFNLEAIFHRFLYFTGARYEEGRGLSLADLFQGKLKDSVLGKALDNAGVDYFGYVVLDSQFDGVSNQNEVLRKPLKGRKSISERDARIVPIIDRDLWNQLVDLAEALHQKHKTDGGDRRNYLFFQGITASTSDARLKAAFQANGLHYRSWHCCRHSRATWLIGELKEPMIVRLWTGHKSINVLEKYNHIYQAIIRKAKTAEVLGDEFGFTKV